MTRRETNEQRIPSVPMETPSDTETVFQLHGHASRLADPGLDVHRQLALVEVARHRLDQVVATPTRGRARSSSVKPTPLSIARAGARSGPSVMAALAALRGVARPVGGSQASCRAYPSDRVAQVADSAGTTTPPSAGPASACAPTGDPPHGVQQDQRDRGAGGDREPRVPRWHLDGEEILEQLGEADEDRRQCRDDGPDPGAHRRRSTPRSTWTTTPRPTTPSPRPPRRCAPWTIDRSSGPRAIR